MFLIGEVSRTQQIVFFLRKLWSKACREKSADVIVPKVRVLKGKDKIVQCNNK